MRSIQNSNRAFLTKIKLHKIYSLVAFGLMAILITACGTAPPSPEPTPTAQESETDQLEVRVYPYENDAAIDFNYSTDWIFVVPQQGFIAVGPSTTVIGDEPGPLMGILRIPNQKVHGSLEGEFNHYLDFGPKRDGYSIVQDITDFEIDGRPAKQIRMSYEGNAENNEIPQEAWIVGAEANGGAVYIFSATAPPENWLENQLLFKLLVESVKFNE